jgi:hypothetical protein
MNIDEKKPVSDANLDDVIDLGCRLEAARARWMDASMRSAAAYADTTTHRNALHAITDEHPSTHVRTFARAILDRDDRARAPKQYAEGPSIDELAILLRIADAAKQRRPLDDLLRDLDDARRASDERAKKRAERT